MVKTKYFDVKTIGSYLMKVSNDDGYLDRHLLIKHTYLRISEMIKNSTQKYSPSELKYRIKNMARVLCGWANIQYDNNKSVFENIKRASEMIRKTKIIFANYARADILLRILYDIINVINSTEYKELKYIAVSYLYSASFLLYDVKLPMPEHNTDFSQYIEELILDYYKHKVMPKGIEETCVVLSKNNEIAKNTFFEDIYRRIERNTNNLIFIEGEHGVGKSYTALHMAMEIDPDFCVEEQVVFDIPSFIERCNEFKRKNLIGKVIVFDEVGAAASALTSWDVENILFDRYLQLFRYLRLTVIFTARDISETIRRLRKRVTHYVYMEEPQKCVIYKLKSKFDISKDKLEIDYERYYYEDDYNIYLLKFKVPTVPKDIAKQYEELRDKCVTKNYLEKIEEEIKFLKKDVLLVDMAKDFIQNHLHNEDAYIQKGKYAGRISTQFLEEQYNIGEKTARKLRKIIEDMIKTSKVTNNIEG